MKKKVDYDIIVIGSGSGGLTVAYTAVGLGKKVLLVEKALPGGECTWSGCIPSKRLIHLAKEMAVVRQHEPSYEVDVPRVLKQVRETIQKVYSGETPEVLESHHIHYLKGAARFKSKNSIEVEGQLYTGKKFVIATGSSPFVPPIEGIDQVNYLTNDTLFLAEDLPSSIIVLGGGAIGVEMSMAINNLGIEVHLIEMAKHILPLEEVDMSSRLKIIMEKQGITVHTSSKALSISQSKISGIVELVVEKEGHKSTIEARGLLVSVGRKANIDDLELENGEVETHSKGIKVDSYMRTTNHQIYAVGDVASKYQFSHMAYAQGIKAGQNAIFPWKRKVSYKHVAWCTYASPELARAGMTEKEAKDKYGESIRVYSLSYDDIDRAKTEDTTEGFIKLIVGRRGQLLGASILGERAGELICELQVIKTLGISPTKLMKVIHPYPTYSEALVTISKNIMIDRLVNNPVVKIFRK